MTYNAQQFGAGVLGERGKVLTGEITCISSIRSPFKRIVLIVALMRQACVCLSVVCMEYVVAKRCVVEQKLLWTAYRKSYVRNRLVPK